MIKKLINITDTNNTKLGIKINLITTELNKAYKFKRFSFSLYSVAYSSV